MKLTKEQIIKIKKGYTGTHQSCQKLAEQFGVSRCAIAYHVNHAHFKDHIHRWRRENPKKWQAIVRKAVTKYQQTKRGKKVLRDYYLKKGKAKLIRSHQTAKWKKYAREWYLRKKAKKHD